jgi:ferrous iron transport protein B
MKARVLNRFGLNITLEAQQDKIIALAGNPNVGKSTVFNSLTGLNQHTGNWPGKTVGNAYGRYRHENKNYTIVDIPGTYSLMANSAEEEIARDFICFGNPDAVVVVADATCLERNLSLLLQTLEITDRVVLCVNLMDEAENKHIRIDLKKLQQFLGIPVVGTSARSGQGLGLLMTEVTRLVSGEPNETPLQIRYCDEIEHATALLLPAVQKLVNGRLPARWTALRLLDMDESLLSSIEQYLGSDIQKDEDILICLSEAVDYLERNGIMRNSLRDRVVSRIVVLCEKIGHIAIKYDKADYAARDRKIDKILTSKLTGIPVMLLLLFGVLWLTISGANYPSSILAGGLFWIEDRLRDLFTLLSAPEWLTGAFLGGVYRTLAWVVSVMLPPMAIFFPLFTLLEDLGYLPRIAFNLDNLFRKACAHGKQALTMCMGFGCNAAGIIGCRIIDSPRERLIAIITNNFVPCNGRFPTLIAVIAMFFAGAVAGAFASLVSTLTLTLAIVLGVTATIYISKILSKTVLKGLPSSFTLELPPYRRPQILRIIVRSVFDRTLFVLGRAVTVAAPAGLVIWLLANIYAGGASLLTHCAVFLDPFGRLMGLDGYILLAFILGFPANEIVVPIIIMSYLSTGTLIELEHLGDLHTLFVSRGWTWLTAVSMMLFCLFHWPCGTTLITIKKETGSLKWTFLSFAIPTVTGIILCIVTANIVRFLSLV